MADAKLVKQLREETGAAVLDCKNALDQYEGDFDKAKEYLAEKGLATARKKADRAANEGLVETYTHTGGRVGVMVEVNCETDFVSATDAFQTFARNIALHIAFANPKFVDSSSIPEDELEAAKKEFYDEAKASGKPDNIVEKIVEGRLNKWFGEVCLMEQPFVKDDEILIKDLVIKTIGELKENIKIARFARFELGETNVEDEGEDE